MNFSFSSEKPARPFRLTVSDPIGIETLKAAAGIYIEGRTLNREPLAPEELADWEALRVTTDPSYETFVSRDGALGWLFLLTRVSLSCGPLSVAEISNAKAADEADQIPTVIDERTMCAVVAGRISVLGVELAIAEEQYMSHVLAELDFIPSSESYL